MRLAAPRIEVEVRSTRRERADADPARSSERAASVSRTLARLRTPRRQGSLWRRGLLASVLSVCVVLALSGGVAQATPSSLVLFGRFGSVTPAPLGVAVDQPSGDVFVVGFHSEPAPPVEKFDASGNVLSPPSPFGSNFGAGAAIDPLNGDLDVLNIFGTIETFDPNSGALVQVPFPVSVSGVLTERLGLELASDSAGNVYLPVPSENEVLEYSPTGLPVGTFTGGTGENALKAPMGVAVDAAGDVWVADTGNNRVEELSPAGVPLAHFESRGVRSLALDSHGDVLAIVKNSADFCGNLTAPCSHLMEYSATGAVLADVGAASFETTPRSGAEPERLPPMVAVNDASGLVYVTDTAGERVWMFGPPAAPIVHKQLSAEVGVSEARLGALVNPGGLETTYRIEYDTREYREGEEPHGQRVPVPEGSAGEGVSSSTVWAAASGLAPGTTYHYRVVATNELGQAVGPDQTFTTGSAALAACSNEALRGGFAARLPDCRAYELVTPSVKSSVEFDRGTGARSSVVARDGDAISLETHEPFPGAPTGGIFYLGTRGPDGWGVEDISPTESYTGALCTTHNSTVPWYSDELSKAVIVLGENARASGGGGLENEGNKESCDAEGLQVVAGEPVGYQNLLVRENGGGGAYRLVNALAAGVTPADAKFEGASGDLSHVVFSEMTPLIPGAPYGLENLYEWDEGVLRLVSVLPDGSPVVGSLPEARYEDHEISTNGSHVFFTAEGALYVRIDGERTVELDERQGGSGASGGGAFQTATADGSKVFFLDENQLTSNSTAQSGKPDLYECVLPDGPGKCELTDLTVAVGGEHADVLGVPGLGVQDSSYVYFFAKGVLAANKREYINAEGKSVSESATSGQTNLYVWNGATTSFIATVGESESFGGQSSPEGAWLAFSSMKSLTGYGNVGTGGSVVEEIFLYNASSGQLVCASCNPSGEAPVSGGGANMPQFSPLAPRYLAEGGRLFFETSQPLLPADTNGQSDVYEYEAGQLSLISSGTSPSQSIFIGASASGDDVFFDTHQQLVPQDTQEGMQAVYDARIGGGFPVSSTPPECATADACRAPVSPQPSIYGAPSSQTFSAAQSMSAATSPPSVKTRVSPKPACKRGFVKRKVKGKSRCIRLAPHKAKKSARTKGHK